MRASLGGRCGNGSAALQTWSTQSDSSLIAIDRRISLRRKGEDLRLDIERKRAMFPKHKISRPGFLRFIAGIGASHYGLSRRRQSAFQMVEDFQKP